MLMHRMTFPSTAQVSLDAAGVLTDRAAKMEGGGGGTQNTNAFFSLQNEEKVKV